MSVPTLPSVSVTFAVMVWFPTDNEFVLKERVLFASEPSILEYQSSCPVGCRRQVCLLLFL